MWPRTGVQDDEHVPVDTIDRDKSMSTVNVVVLPEPISKGVVVFSSPDGTVNTTFVPSAITPVAEPTTIRICVYFPGPNRALASRSETFTKDARSTVVRARVTLCHPDSFPAPASWIQTSVNVTFTWVQSPGASCTRTSSAPSYRYT